MSTRTFLLAFFSLILFISADSVPGAYEYIVNEEIDYSILLEDERMIPFSWSNFDISFEETVQRILVFVSTKKIILENGQELLVLQLVLHQNIGL